MAAKWFNSLDTNSTPPLSAKNWWGPVPPRPHTFRQSCPSFLFCVPPGYSLGLEWLKFWSFMTKHRFLTTKFEITKRRHLCKLRTLITKQPNLLKCGKLQQIITKYKGQLISKRLLGIIVLTKKLPKVIKDFCPSLWKEFKLKSLLYNYVR